MAERQKFTVAGSAEPPAEAGGFFVRPGGYSGKRISEYNESKDRPPSPVSAVFPGRGSVAGHKVNSTRQGRREYPLGDSAQAEKPTRMSVSQAGNRRTQGAELIAWAVVKDDNLHRRPKRAPVTLPAANGIRLQRKTAGGKTKRSGRRRERRRRAWEERQKGLRRS